MIYKVNSGRNMTPKRQRPCYDQDYKFVVFKFWNIVLGIYCKKKGVLQSAIIIRYAVLTLNENITKNCVVD